MDSNGLSGGIALFWSADVKVDLKNYSSGHINVMVQKMIKVPARGDSRDSMEPPEWLTATTAGGFLVGYVHYHARLGCVLEISTRHYMPQNTSRELPGLNGRCEHSGKSLMNACSRI